MASHPKNSLFSNFGVQIIPESFVNQTIINDFGIRWNSALERLSVIAVPLLLAAASKKKKSRRNKAKRKPKKIRRAKTRRIPKKRNSKSARGKAFKSKPWQKKQLKPKAVQPPPKPVKEEEPLPPPVAPIGRAILLVPKDGAYVESPHPTLRWLSVGGSTKYEVHWGEDQTLATRYSTVSLATEATIPVEKPLHVGAIYYWRVRGGNDAGWGPWSTVSSFRVLEETA